MLETGQQVKQIVPIIQGSIIEIQYNNSAKSLECLVEFVEGSETYQRWFKESELEAV